MLRRLFCICAVTVAVMSAAAARPEANAAVKSEAKTVAVPVAKPVISILGDSYSTFEGYIPQGNAVWYFLNPDKDVTDVNDVRQTWWWQLISEGGYKLGVNDSYSGATVCYTGYNGDDYSDRSFITRLPRVGSPDILLIFGATNDSWANSPIGEFVGNIGGAMAGVAPADSLAHELNHHKYPEGRNPGSLYEFRPALCELLTEAQNRLPGTRIVYIINSELKPEITSSIKQVCGLLGVEYIELQSIDKLSGHPSRLGMTQIKDQVLEFLQK